MHARTAHPQQITSILSRHVNWQQIGGIFLLPDQPAIKRIRPRVETQPNRHTSHTFLHATPQGIAHILTCRTAMKCGKLKKLQ